MGDKCRRLLADISAAGCGVSVDPVSRLLLGHEDVLLQVVVRPPRLCAFSVGVSLQVLMDITSGAFQLTKETFLTDAGKNYSL